MQNIKIAVETLQKEFTTSSESFHSAQSVKSAAARLGRGLGGISELVRLFEVTNVGKMAAQAARAVRVAETVTGVLSALFVAVDVFFIFLDSREIHKISQDYTLRERQRETEFTGNQLSNKSETNKLLPSNIQQAEEMKSETMKFVMKIKKTTASDDSGYVTRRTEPKL